MRLTSDIVAELSVTRGAEVLLAAVALQRVLVRLAGLQSPDDLVQREHGVLLQGLVRHDALVAGAQNVNSVTSECSIENHVCQAKNGRKKCKKPLIKVK